MSLVYKSTDGAPVKIYYNIETDIDKDVRETKIYDTFTYDRALPEKFNFVDHDRSSNGGRLIDLRITKIEDQAGNILNLDKVFNFYVFANILQLAKPTETDNGAKIADGQINQYSQTFKDVFGNQIIPASGIGRVISRTNQASVNTMFLDQRERSGGTSVFIDNVPLAFPITGNAASGKMAEIPQNSSDGKYSFNLRVYTPTANAYNAGDPISDLDAKFSLSSTLIVRDDQTKIRSTPEVSLTSHILDNPAYKPLFTTKIVGDAREGGFIE